MWDNTTITMLLEGTRDTLYMTLVSTFFGYVLGLPLGILLAVTDKEGIHPNAVVYKVLDVIVNILRSTRMRQSLLRFAIFSNQRWQSSVTSRMFGLRRIMVLKTVVVRFMRTHQTQSIMTIFQAIKLF